jgi:hypothetical protein
MHWWAISNVITNVIGEWLVIAMTNVIGENNGQGCVWLCKAVLVTVKPVQRYFCIVGHVILWVAVMWLFSLLLYYFFVQSPLAGLKWTLLKTKFKPDSVFEEVFDEMLVEVGET